MVALHCGLRAGQGPQVCSVWQVLNLSNLGNLGLCFGPLSLQPWSRGQGRASCARLFPCGRRFRQFGVTMGKAHLDLQRGRLVWSHLWTNNRNAFAWKWRTLSEFLCFAMEATAGYLKY